ncbi:nucleotidyltransferase substrate binding protein [Bacillaceae bacterium]
MNGERILEKFDDYQNALKRLGESLKLNLFDSIVVDGVIQRFEFTFELGWKLMKAILEYEGISEVNSPRGTIKEAFKFGLIENGDDWIAMMVDRNKTSHIYDEKEACEIYNRVKQQYYDLFRKLYDNVRVRIGELENK